MKEENTETMAIPSRGILLWSQDQINSVWAHTHKKTIIKIFNHYFINFLFIIKIILLYVCVTNHYLFGLVTILEFRIPSQHSFSLMKLNWYILLVFYIVSNLSL